MKQLLIFMLITSFAHICYAAGSNPFIVKNYAKGSFLIANKQKAASIIFSQNEWKGVVRAANDLEQDIKKVTGATPGRGIAKMSIIIGTIGSSKIIDQLISSKKINVAGISGKWESTLIEVVKNPLPGIDSALIIAGSDKRGTIYGIYEVSGQIGVSPWYYWADVPVKTSDAVYALEGRHIISSPAVKYRGIFLNDEAPALSRWSKKEFGGFNHKFYEKVFELILRLKGNYIWPAMWGSAFNDDDKMNPVTADEYGVVMGTSHHEPLARAHDEWKRYKGGKWNYEQNPKQLKAFWESGLARVADKEQIITIGMRGDGDEPMTQGTATALLENIVKDQRTIIGRVTGKPASQTPQLWALYKEVQDYYEKGMTVPDDVTLLLCDDNWGNLRKLPDLSKANRSGGYGIYYHFDYVGGPRNYKWINTNPIQKIWEQMNLAYQYKSNQIWIVNVGDLKPMEFPIQFFLDYAWAPEAIPAENLKGYTIDWASKQFDHKYATDIAEIIDLYSKYNGRRKPELLNEDTYSLVNYSEFEIIVEEFSRLEKRAKKIYAEINPDQKDAFYQLVLHPVEASSNLNRLYFAVAKNRLYAKQGRNATNELARQVDSLFKRDAEISLYYNKTMANGKWDHMMDQTHIGYAHWQEPKTNVVPKTYTTQTDDSRLGIAIEGSESAWFGHAKISDAFPKFDRYNKCVHYLEIFNTGTATQQYIIKAPPYLIVDFPEGEISIQKRINLSIDWQKAPADIKEGLVEIMDSKGVKITLPIVVDNREYIDKNINGFIEKDGFISIEAINYTRSVDSKQISWRKLINYGRTAGGMITVPATAKAQSPGANTAHLEYDFYINDSGKIKIQTYLSPTIDFKNIGGLKFAVSVDDQTPIILNTNTGFVSDKGWAKSVADNIKIIKTEFTIHKPGKHTLKYWVVDAGIVLEKFVMDIGGLKPSYLGPQETPYVIN